MNKEVTGTDISHLISANASIQLNQIQKNLLLIVFEWRRLDPLDYQGICYLKECYFSQISKRLEEMLWEFEDKDPNDPSTWYEPKRWPHVRPDVNHVGMTEIYHHRYICDRVDLWIAIDWVNIDPLKKSQGSQTVSSTGMSIWMRAHFPLRHKVCCRSKSKISKQAVFRQSIIHFSILRHGSKHNLKTEIRFVQTWLGYQGIALICHPVIYWYLTLLWLMGCALTIREIGCKWHNIFPSTLLVSMIKRNV